MRRVPTMCCLASAVIVSARLAGAVPVDGRLDPDYGPPLSTQTTQTSLGDSPGGGFYASELDGAFAYVADDTLHVLITGSYSRFFSEPLIFANQLQLYVDTGPGGQNPIGGANPSVGFAINLQLMAGLVFDSDFAPDYWLAGARDEGNAVHAYYAELPAGGGGAGYYLGSGSIGGPGTLSGSGASNPFGILAAVDISNEAGVTAGCDAASGAGVTTGIEWAVPLAALGNPSESIRICALLVSAGGQVSNQVLGPVPPGTCALGPASGVDLQSVPGSQYFVIEVLTPTARATWGWIKAAYR